MHRTFIILSTWPEQCTSPDKLSQCIVTHSKAYQQWTMATAIRSSPFFFYIPLRRHTCFLTRILESTMRQLQLRDVNSQPPRQLLHDKLLVRLHQRYDAARPVSHFKRLCTSRPSMGAQYAGARIQSTQAISMLGRTSVIFFGSRIRQSWCVKSDR